MISYDITQLLESLPPQLSVSLDVDLPANTRLGNYL
jgi:hypothetical protein